MNYRSFFSVSLLSLFCVLAVPMHGMDNDIELQPSLPSIPAESVVKDDGAKIKAEIDLQLKMIEGITEIPVHLRDGTDFTLKLDDNDLLTQGSYKASLQGQIEYQESHDVETRQFILARVTSVDNNNHSFVSYYSAHTFNRYIFAQVKKAAANGYEAEDQDDDVQEDYPLMMHEYMAPRYDLGERYTKPPVTDLRKYPIQDSMSGRKIRSSDDVEYFVYDPLEHNKGFTFIGTYKDMIQCTVGSQKFLNKFCRNQSCEDQSNDDWEDDRRYNVDLRYLAYALYHKLLMDETSADTEAGRKKRDEHKSKALEWLGKETFEEESWIIWISSFYFKPIFHEWDMNDPRTIECYVNAMKLIDSEYGACKSWMLQRMRAVVGLAVVEESRRKELLQGYNQHQLLSTVAGTGFQLGGVFKLDGGTVLGLTPEVEKQVFASLDRLRSTPLSAELDSLSTQAQGDSILTLLKRENRRGKKRKEREQKEQKQADRVDEDASGAKRLRLENGSSSSSSSSSS